MDVEIAMSALDKIMRANELTFHLVSAIPTVLFIKYILGKVYGFLSSRNSLYGFVLHSNLKGELHALSKHICFETTLVDDYDLSENEGRILVSIFRLAALVCLDDQF